MFTDHGVNRVIEPKNVFPVSAWKLDNSEKIYSNEILVRVKRLHFEAANFKQICNECNNDIDKIKEKVMAIVERRGKLHNPFTDTGGVLYGTIEEIGEDYINESQFVVGDEIIGLASLTMLPLKIEKIINIDFLYGQADIEGYCIFFSNCPIVKKPVDVPTEIALLALDDSGSIFHISKEAENGNKFLVVGNDIITMVLYGYTIKSAKNFDCELVGVIDKSSGFSISKQSDKIMYNMEKIFDKMYEMDILKPLECTNKLHSDHEDLFDLSVNCANIPGAETINALMTRPKGSIFFPSLINNYSIALFICEGIGRQANIHCSEGYMEGYKPFMVKLLKDMSKPIKEIAEASKAFKDIKIHHMDKNSVKVSNLYNKKGMIDDFIYYSGSMDNVLNEAINVAKYDCNVLIRGETGVGKEKIASIIHKNSNRKMNPFIKINCASINSNLLESEFFGYEKGAFTGAANTGKQGYFELADTGIIFLDEIGELPLDMQAKLLRVIQDGEFYRVGGIRPIKTNVRVISATNQNLENMIENNMFRKDLYYRLNVFPITIPPLRERKQEVIPLAEFFIKNYKEKFNVNVTFDSNALYYLSEYDWPGNIRELENMIQRILINNKGERITAFDIIKELNKDLIGHISEYKHEEFDYIPLKEILESYEKKIIEFALKKHKSTRKAADALGISQTQMVRKKHEYNISV